MFDICQHFSLNELPHQDLKPVHPFVSPHGLKIVYFMHCARVWKAFPRLKVNSPLRRLRAGSTADRIELETVDLPVVVRWSILHWLPCCLDASLERERLRILASLMACRSICEFKIWLRFDCNIEKSARRIRPPWLRISRYLAEFRAWTLTTGKERAKGPTASIHR